MPPSSADRRRPSNPRRKRRLLMGLAVLAVVAEAGMTPWAFHIGDRLTPLMTWNGFGELRASNGGRYVLFTHLLGGIGGHGCSYVGGCDDLHGTASLCGRNGSTESFTLAGRVRSWLTTDGARTSIRLTNGTPTALPDGWVVAFSGAWSGPELILASPDDSFTEVFTPEGGIRTATSDVDRGTARVRLKYGTAAEFQQACRALARSS